MIHSKDFACSHCGKGYPDFPYEGKCPETIPCECGKEASWTFQRVNLIHTTHSSQYGRFDPRFGCVVESYEHKQSLLKTAGKEETVIERYDDIQNDVDERQAAQAAKGERDPNMLIADSLEQINEQIDNDQIDRGHTGTPLGREDQDPDTGLIDAWRTL